MRPVPAVLLAALLGACAAAPSARPADGDRGALVRVDVVFEPPLPADGTLVVEHESGVTLRVTAAPSGVRLRLPPGPVAARLESAGAVDERAFVVAAGAPVFVWRR